MTTNAKPVDRLEYRNLSSAVALLVGASSVAGPALAQQPTTTPQEEIVVTGSYLERPANRPQPVTVISAAELNLEQRQSLAEKFKNLPQVQGTSAIVNGNENFVSPTTNVNLRGLGARATLVLMNGRRQTIDGNTGLDGVVSVDINNLSPSIMIERVEVLTDGASALYGSDAVAGVVNLITRNGFDGIEVKTEMQSIDEIGSSDFTVGALFGSQGSETSVVAGIEWSHQERMNVEDRYSTDRILLAALPSAFANPGTLNANTSGVGPPQFIADPLCGSDEIGGGIGAGLVNFTGPTDNFCRMSLALGRAIVPEVEQLNGLAVATHELTPDITAQVELGFARARYQYDFGYGLPIILSPGLLLPATNPGVVAENARSGLPIQDYLMSYRIRSPAGDEPTNTIAEQDTYRFAGSLLGEFGDSGWGWTATATFSQNDSLNIGGDTIEDRVRNAFMGLGGPDCDPATGTPGQEGCLWYNPLANRFLASPGDANYNDPSLPDFLFARSRTDGFAELTTLDLVVTGEIGQMAGGPTGLAVGIQTRSQEFFVDFDPITEAGGFAFNSAPLADYGGVRDTDALFAELVMFPTESIEIQLAARYEDYGSVDSTDPKIGFLWTPTERLFFRATAGTSFRQPGETQSFGSASQGSTTRSIGGQVINARGLLVGNPNLAPESSDNFTIGFTWDITDNFTMDINYFSIEFTDLIVPEDGDVILVNDMTDGFIADPRIRLFPNAANEVCEISRGAFDPNDPACMTGDDFDIFILGYVNQDFQETSGIDFNFDYRFSAAGSDWGIGLNGTYTDKYDLTSEGQLFNGAGNYNAGNFGFPNADLLANLKFDWMRGNHRARATLRHISALQNDDAANPLTEENSFDTLDLLYDHTLPSGRGAVTFAILNATDEEDPVRQGDLRSTTSFVYDLRGRMYRMGFTWSL
jgi:outer membrane receptor protein involved in Fe transport